MRQTGFNQVWQLAGRPGAHAAESRMDRAVIRHDDLIAKQVRRRLSDGIVPSVSAFEEFHQASL